MILVQPVRAIALVSILILGVLGCTPVLGGDWKFSVLPLDPGNGQSSPDLAVHWAGPLPASLVRVRKLPGGELSPSGEARTLAGEMSLVRGLRFDKHETLAVIDREGAVLATASMGEQSFGWRSQFVGPGLDGEVMDMLVHDGALIVGGWFKAAGQQLASSIARWDGSNWSAFGSDAIGNAPEFNGSVRALEIHGGDVVAAGDFTQIGGQPFNRIARWDGTGWQPLGSGADNGVSGSISSRVSIETVTVHDGHLLVGGRFESAGAAAASNLARWNGTSWLPVTGGDGGEGVGKEAGTGYPMVHALASYNGELVVGGDFNQAGGLEASHLARWSNGSWLNIPRVSGGQGSGWPVFAMTPFGGGLAIGGEIPSVNNVEVWDGSTLETLGYLSPMDDYQPRVIENLTVMDGDLYAVGSFRLPFSAGLGFISIARWTGTRWQPVESTDGDMPGSGGRALAVLGNRLIAGGAFLKSGDVRLNNLAAYDGQQWHTLEPAGTGGILRGNVQASAIWNGDLVVGGSFRWVGSQVVNNLARWDGASWHGFPGDSGIGLRTGSGTPGVSALEVFEGDLIVAGQFESAGGLAVQNIARYGAQGWVEMDAPNQYEGAIRALTLWNDQLVAPLVTINQFGQEEATHVAAYDGSAWSLLHDAGATGFKFGRVLHLESYGEEIHAGGRFSEIDGLPTLFLACYDGLVWRSVAADPAEGPDSEVRAMAVFDNELYVAANRFNGDGLGAVRIARWDGQDWKSLRNERTRGWQVGEIDKLATVSGRLYGIGNFVSDAQGQKSSVARYDGTDWAAVHGPLSHGTGLEATHIAQWDGRPLAGGSFQRAGGLPAWGLATHSLEPSLAEITDVQAESFPLNSALVTARVSGAGSAPIDGKLVVESDQGEWCISSEIVPAGYLSVELQCRIEYQGGGDRHLIAAFSASSSHKDSTSAPVDTHARWPSQTHILHTTPENEQASGQPIEVVVGVSGSGNPAGRVVVDIDTGEQCEVNLPGDRCTLYASSAGQTHIGAYYVGDTQNQPSSDSIAFNIVPSGFQFDPQQLDFGPVGIGQSQGPMLMEVTNVSAGVIQIQEITLPTPPFQQLTGGSCPQSPFSLANAESCTLAYGFSPLSAQTFRSTITVRSDLSGSPHVFILAGSGEDVIYSDAFIDENH